MEGNEWQYPMAVSMSYRRNRVNNIMMSIKTTTISRITHLKIT